MIREHHPDHMEVKLVEYDVHFAHQYLSFDNKTMTLRRTSCNRGNVEKLP